MYIYISSKYEIWLHRTAIMTRNCMYDMHNMLHPINNFDSFNNASVRTSVRIARYRKTTETLSRFLITLRKRRRKALHNIYGTGHFLFVLLTAYNRTQLDGSSISKKRPHDTSLIYTLMSQFYRTACQISITVPIN